jgi:RNA polymerase sigma factor (sigma-70 family)
VNEPTPSQHPSQFSTREHVQCWQDGEGAALGRLCERLGPLLRYRIQNNRNWPKVQRQHSLEDVEQEVWARVIGSGPGAFQPTEAKRAFVSWLGQIADAALVDLIRQAEAAKRGGGDQPGVLDSLAEAQRLRRPGQLASLSPTAQARIGEFEQVALKVLNERELKAWKWVVLENYTSTEAAMALDCTAAAIRSLLVRSRGKLKEALSDP